MAENHSFGKRSEGRLATVDPRLAEVVRDALKVVPFDLTVLTGHRSREDQERAVRLGRSRVHYPRGKHNRLPSLAVDLAPYPIDWHDRPRFVFLAGVMTAAGRERGLDIRWGGNWDGDGTLITDQTLVDLPHFELLE